MHVSASNSTRVQDEGAESWKEATAQDRHMTLPDYSEVPEELKLSSYPDHHARKPLPTLSCGQEHTARQSRPGEWGKGGSWLSSTSCNTQEEWGQGSFQERWLPRRRTQ